MPQVRWGLRLEIVVLRADVSADTVYASFGPSKRRHTVLIKLLSSWGSSAPLPVKALLHGVNPL